MSEYIEGYEPVEDVPGLFEVTYATYAHRDHRAERTEVACYTVYDEEGLGALPVGTRVIDFDEIEWSHPTVWEKADSGRWIYAPETQPIVGISQYYGIEPRDFVLGHYVPMVVANPEILGEFHPYHDVPASLPDSDDMAGYRAVLHHRKGWRAGDFHGFPVEIVSWPNVHEFAEVRPLAPRPDRHVGNFLWRKDRMVIGAKANEVAA